MFLFSPEEQRTNEEEEEEEAEEEEAITNDFNVSAQGHIFGRRERVGKAGRWGRGGGQNDITISTLSRPFLGAERHGRERGGGGGGGGGGAHWK